MDSLSPFLDFISQFSTLFFTPICSFVTLDFSAAATRLAVKASKR